MKGRKPKPVELRVLHGSAYERAKAELPRPRRVLPRCPDYLTGDAEKCWHRLARELYDAGLLATIDRDAEVLPEPWKELFLKLGRSLD